MTLSLPSVVGVVMALVAIAVILVAARRRTPADLDGDRKSSHWMAVGIAGGLALGVPTGLALGVALENMAVGVALGPAIGVGMGIAIGAALEARHKGEPAPPGESEPLTFGRFSLAAGVVLFLVFLVLAALLLRRCAPVM